MVEKSEGSVNSITLTDKVDRLAANEVLTEPGGGDDGEMAALPRPPHDTELVRESLLREFVVVERAVWIALPDGTIEPVNPGRLSAVADGALRGLIKQARLTVTPDEYFLPECEQSRYWNVVSRHDVSELAAWTNELILNARAWGVRMAPAWKLGKEPVYMLADGTAFDVRTGEVLCRREDVLDALIPHNPACGAWYKPELLNTPPTEVAEIFAHYGELPMRRMARHLAFGAEKDVDVFKAHANFGKSTLIAVFKKALPGLVDAVDGRHGLSANTERFSMVRRMLTTGRILFVDESDKIAKGSDAGLLNSLTGNELPVELKGVDGGMRKRTAVPVMLGNQWPDLLAGEGADERINWGWEWSGDATIDRATHKRWAENQDVAEWLSTWLLDTAFLLYASGDDTDTPESREFARQALDSMRSDEQVLMAELFKVGGAGDQLANAAIKAVLEDAGYDKDALGKGKAFGKAVKSFSPNARQVGSGKNRGWTHLRVRYAAD